MLQHGRKIATILAADVVEYSRLMGADDEATLSALNARRAIFDRLIHEFEGREFGSVGDSLMAEFPSAVNAVRCAQAIQQAVAKENESLAPEQRMSLRIGLDLGDVIDENGTLFGEAVNVAARLQSLAAPGGILISGAVHEHVRKKLQARLSYAGARHVKNIADPVPAYEVLAVDKRRSLLETVARYPRRWGVAAAMALAALLAGTLWYWRGGSLLWLDAQGGRQTTATDVVGASPALTTSAADTRPSIAILPFSNRSRQPDDVFFVDGVHDDILTQLSKVSALRVISHTSVERFRKSDLSVQQIAQQLGVRSILEGAVQRAGDRVRISVQLIDAATDSHVWAESYDRELDAANIFAIQSELAAAIAGVLKTTLTPAEQARANQLPTRSLEAWEAYQRGKQRLAKRTSAALIEAERHFRDAIALDRDFALAWVGLADSLALQTGYAGRPKDSGLADAEHALTRALTLEPNLAEAWASSGLLAAERQQLEQSEQMLRRAIALNPNYAPAQHWLGRTLTSLGRRDEALVIAERAVVLDPLSAIINNSVGVARSSVGRLDAALAAYRQAIEIDPAMAVAYYNIGDVYALGFGRFDTAIAWYKKAASLDPGDLDTFAAVTFTYWNLGDDAEAGRWLDQMLATGKATGFTDRVAALIFLDRGNTKSARSHAQRAAEQDPGYLYLITDDDRRRGDFTAARAEYAKAYPHLLAKEVPPLNESDFIAAIDLAGVLQHTGENERAEALLNRSQAYFRTFPRMGPEGFAILDVVIHTLRGETKLALARLREAEQAGWRSEWRYCRDFEPTLASIRNEPEFKAVFADIARDVARQRAVLASHPKDAHLPVAEPGT